MRPKTVALLTLVLTMALAASGLARADEGNRAVTDEGNNIYLVNGNSGSIPNLLPVEEVQKITALQSAPPGYFLSPVSADDQTILVLGRQFSFVNIHDGTALPVPFPPSDFPGAFLGLLSNTFWIDNNTVGLFVLSQSDAVYVTLLAFDRRTGESRVVSNSSDLSNVPVFVSPYGQKVLLASAPQAAAGSDLVTRVSNSFASGSAATSLREVMYRGGWLNQPREGSRARALLDFAEAFDPLEDFAINISGDNSQLSVLDTETGETRPVTTLERGFNIKDISFSTDGNKLAVAIDGLSLDPNRGRDGALLSDLIYRDVTGNIPPAENPVLQGNRLITLDFPSGEVRQLRPSDSDVYAGASWSADYQTLVVKMQSPGRVAGRRYPQYVGQFRSGSSLRFYTSDLQEIRRVARSEISDLELQVSFVSPDEVIIQSQNGLNRHPYYYNWRSGEFRDIGDRPGTFSPVRSTNHSREIVFAYSSYTDPIDIYRMSWEGTAFARLTWASESIRQLNQTRQYPVSFTLRDRSTISGVLILPADVPFPPKNIPIVAWQEGGPTTLVQNKWDAQVENPFGLLPNFGFGVLVTPLYGRYGFGPARFHKLVDGTNFGQTDIDAQAEIMNQLRTRGWASKVGIVGCSYGGYFTSQSVTRHPETYDAAHTMCSLVDMFTEWSRGFDSLAPWMEGLPPANAVVEYTRDSPLYNVSRVRTPLLAFHGTKDFLPVTVMENFMLQVINNKVPAKMLKFQDAEHSFQNKTPPQLSPIYELYGAQEQLIWFRTYLMKN